MAGEPATTADDIELPGGIQAKVPTWKPIVMQAKHQTPCSYCHLPISPGNAIYPWVCRARESHHQPRNVTWSRSLHTLLQGNYTGYMHLSCALKEADQQNVELLPPVSVNLCMLWCNYISFIQSAGLHQDTFFTDCTHEQVCKHWSRRGYCLYKDKCFYQHPLDALPRTPDPVNTG